MCVYEGITFWGASWENIRKFPSEHRVIFLTWTFLERQEILCNLIMGMLFRTGKFKGLIYWGNFQPYIMQRHSHVETCFFPVNSKLFMYSVEFQYFTRWFPVSVVLNIRYYRDLLAELLLRASALVVTELFMQRSHKTWSLSGFHLRLCNVRLRHGA